MALMNLFSYSGSIFHENEDNLMKIQAERLAVMLLNVIVTLTHVDPIYLHYVFAWNHACSWLIVFHSQIYRNEKVG